MIMKLLRVLLSNLTPLLVGAALLVAATGVACASATDPVEILSGVSDDHILFGQSAVFSGPAQDLGRDMRLGIKVAFYEVNQAGGVHGRRLELKTMDDSYETDYAFHTTKRLIENVGVFALIGAVGTPTTRVSRPLAHEVGVPFLAPFTGAEFLRDPGLDNVVNLRASYYQETEEMIARLTEDLGVSRVAVFYQDDSFGANGLEGVRRALELRGLEPVGAWDYQRNSGVVRQAASSLVEVDPEAVVLIGTQDAVDSTTKLVSRDIRPVFMTVSFVGGTALAKAVEGHGRGVYVTRVVPFPEDASLPVVADYHAALARYDPSEEPGFVSLEGYLAGRLAIFGLEACGRELSRECFMDSLNTTGVIDLDGFQLKFGPNDNQGSDSVFLTVVGADGEYEPVDALRAGS